MVYSTDCNYIVKAIGTNRHYECYTKDDVKKCIKQPFGSFVYKVKPDGKLKLMARINPSVNIKS